MSNFEFNREQIKSQEAELVKINTDLASSMMHLWLPILNLRLYCFLKGSSLDQKLTDTYNYLKNQRKNIFYLKSTLGDIVNIVECGENSAKKMLENKYFELLKLLDEKKMYGGDQSLLEKDIVELSSIVRKYYPTLTDKEVEKYLDDLSSSGCGYVAAVNTIFERYIGKPEEFEKTFGFKMHKKNGELNYDAIITDFYAETDNHYNFFGIDYVNPLEDLFGPRGMKFSDLEYRFESYMNKRGIDVDVHSDVVVTPEKFNAFNQEYDVIIGVYPPAILIKEDGTPTPLNGGHAMKIMGIREDGKYIVSSWGEKYYLNPMENFNRTYALVKYK